MVGNFAEEGTHNYVVVIQHASLALVQLEYLD